MPNGYSPATEELNFTPAGIERVAMSLSSLLASYEESLPERPVFPRLDRDTLANLLREPFSEEGRGVDGLFDRIRAIVIPNSTAIAHPRFLGYVLGPSNGLAPFADAVAAALNQNCNFWQLSPAASVIEKKVTSWLSGLFNFPKGSGGILTSGGSMAMHMALFAAILQKRPNAREDGWQARSSPLAIYTSAEAHQCVEKAVVMLGLGSQALRKIPVDRQFRMDCSALQRAIELDQARGISPCCVVASCGTVATGAIDPIVDIARLCREHGAWLHIDGAYGGLFVLTEELRQTILACGLADSLSLDPHKMLFMPLEAGCLLVRDADCLRRSFHFSAPYLPEGDDPLFTNFMDYGPQLSRSFRAFKIWCALEAFGTRAFASAIERARSVARYMMDRLAADPAFELLAPAPLTAVCFRLRHLDDETNLRVLGRLVREGTALISSVQLNGRAAIRACIANYRTSAADIDLILRRLRQLSAEETGE
jgi:Glutamate decarboxylase and related PLP-dependent proteins